MDCTGTLQSIQKDWSSDKLIMTFIINENVSNEAIEEIRSCEKLSLVAKKWRQKRSLDANAMLWACLSDIAKSMTPPVDKWDVYLQMLKRYGKYTYICIKPHMVDAMKMQWRECEVVGDIKINGEDAVQMLCYFGSSTLDTKEFSVLLEGVVSEMKEMGLPTPPSKEMRRCLEKWKNGEK